jgi:hypothetical protein
MDACMIEDTMTMSKIGSRHVCTLRTMSCVEKSTFSTRMVSLKIVERLRYACYAPLTLHPPIHSPKRRILQPPSSSSSSASTSSSPSTRSTLPPHPLPTTSAGMTPNGTTYAIPVKRHLVSQHFIPCDSSKPSSLAVMSTL